MYCGDLFGACCEHCNCFYFSAVVLHAAAALPHLSPTSASAPPACAGSCCYMCVGLYRTCWKGTSFKQLQAAGSPPTCPVQTQSHVAAVMLLVASWWHHLKMSQQLLCTKPCVDGLAMLSCCMDLPAGVFSSACLGFLVLSLNSACAVCVSCYGGALVGIDVSV